MSTGSDLFDHDAFEQAHSEIETVRQKLPRDALIELAKEVVERLAERLVSVVPSDVRPSDEEIDALCRALVSSERNAAARIIADAQKRGASIDTLYLSYLGEASRRLGEWWEKDTATFVEVTLAAGRIYAILHGLRPAIVATRFRPTKAAVFASVPGEDHTLGVVMAADLFRNRGWDIDLKLGLDHNQLVSEIAKSGATLIGLSGGGQRSIVPLIRLVVALRIANPGARILVSGHVAAIGIDAVGVIGADGAATDFETALSEMERLAGL